MTCKLHCVRVDGRSYYAGGSADAMSMTNVLMFGTELPCGRYSPFTGTEHIQDWGIPAANSYECCRLL